MTELAQDPGIIRSDLWMEMFTDMSKIKDNPTIDIVKLADKFEKLAKEIALLKQGEKEPVVKKYICTDCKTANYLEDNGEIRVGECRNCGHPLWNPADYLKSNQ